MAMQSAWRAWAKTAGCLGIVLLPWSAGAADTRRPGVGRRQRRQDNRRDAGDSGRHGAAENVPDLPSLHADQPMLKAQLAYGLKRKSRE